MRESDDMSEVELAMELRSAPAGVALLESLERAQHGDVNWSEGPIDSDPIAVRAAVEAVGSMSFGTLAQHLVSGAERVAGPWRSDSMRDVTSAFESAAMRTEIAEAVVRRFGAMLEGAVLIDEQEWWLAADDAATTTPVFAGSLGDYCCGEFTWNSVRTVSNPPSEVHDHLIDVWEVFPGPISRWRMPVRSGARVYEVHRPADWARLAAAYPSESQRPHGGRELPGPNQDRRVAAEVERATAGAAARTGGKVVMPDWDEVRCDYDGVHLSWAGMATCEGRVIDVAALGPDVVTILRYWGSERTMWINDVFETPTPLSPPKLTGRVNNEVGIGANDPDRRPLDARTINTALDRAAVGA